MEPLPPEEWMDLTAYQRDILVALMNDGEKFGPEILAMFEDVEGRGSDATMYRHLKELVGKGYVDAEEKDGRENIYRVSSRGVVLLDKVGRVISGTV